MDIHPSFPALCSTILTQAYGVGIIAANRLRTYICPTQDHITLMNVKAACRAQQPRGDVGRHENGAWLTWRLDLAPGGRGLLQEVSPTAWLLRRGRHTRCCRACPSSRSGPRELSRNHPSLVQVRGTDTSMAWLGSCSVPVRYTRAIRCSVVCLVRRMI